jgi:hypothetical protein
MNLMDCQKKGFARDEEPSEKRICGIGAGTCHMLLRAWIGVPQEAGG